MIESEIYSILTEVPALAAVTGGNVFPEMLPENASYPAFVYSVTYMDPVEILSGRSGLEYYEVELVCYGKGPAALSTSAETIKNILGGASRATMEGWKESEYIETDIVEIWVSYEPGNYDHDTQVFEKTLSIKLNVKTGE